MKTAKEIVEARWPGWLKEHSVESSDTVPVLSLIEEGQAEAYEDAADIFERNGGRCSCERTPCGYCDVLSAFRQKAAALRSRA